MAMSRKSSRRPFGKNPVANRKRSKIGNNRSVQLGYEMCEPRNMLSASTDVGGFLQAGQQQQILNYLANQDVTAYLQQGANDLQLVRVENGDTNTTAVFQQTMDGLPIHGTYVSVLSGDSGQILSVEDRGLSFLLTQDSMTPDVTIASAFQVANQNYHGQASLANDAQLVWFRHGNRAELAWQVETVAASGNIHGGDLNFQTVVDADSGNILSQSQAPSVIDELVYDTEAGIFPRIVINDAIGAAGSQAYGATFNDAVVSLALGCTGTLIAENVVISARHCNASAGGGIDFGADSNAPTFSATIQSSILPAGNGTLLDGGDVAILILNENVPDTIATPVRFVDQTSDLVGQTIDTIGYGFNGVGSVGHQNSADGLRWAGQNIIDVYGVPASAGGANIISTDFDDGTAANNMIPGSDPVPLVLEATTAPGDSGGPILVTVGTERAIAGVLSGGTNGQSLYGDISWWTGTAIYKADIELVGGEFVTFGELEVKLNDDVLENNSVFDFGTTGEGRSLTETFTVSNVDSTGDLTLEEPIIVPDGFTITKSFSSLVLGPNQSTTFDLRFDNNPVGSYGGDVIFFSGDADESPFVIKVAGTVAPPIGEAGNVLANRSWTTVFLRNTYLNPVVVAGPPASGEAEPATVRVRNVTPDSFQIKVQEWQYQDRAHVSERVSYAVMESGVHRLSSGTTIIAGNTSGVTTEFSTIPFDLPFNAKPIVLSQTTTVNGGAPVVNRLNNIGTHSFQVMLQEEEAGDQTHTKEIVSWIAFTPDNESTRLGFLAQTSELLPNAVDENEATLAFTNAVSFEDPPVFLAAMQSFVGSNVAALRLTDISTTSATVFVQEEQSKDVEIGHGNESVGFLALDSGDIIGRTIIGEAGQVNNLDRDWQTIQLTQNYIDPVVVVTINSMNEAEPAVARVRNLTNNSFQVHLEEWNYLDLNHAPEMASYVVMESGIHTLRDGTVIEARNATVDSDFSSVIFQYDFDHTPLVFSQASSDNGPATVTTRMKNISDTGFDIKVQEEEAQATRNHVNETVSWIATNQGTGDVGGLFYEIKSFAGGVNHRGASIALTNTFDGAPAVLTNLQSFVGDNTASLRNSLVTADRVDLFVEEEQSLDAETGHGKEEVGLLAINTGIIDGYIIDLYSDPDANAFNRSSFQTASLTPALETQDRGTGSQNIADIQQMMLARAEFNRLNDSAFEQF